MRAYDREYLLSLLAEYEERHGKIPSRRELGREFGVRDKPFMRVFGSWENGKLEYQFSKDMMAPRLDTPPRSATTLTIPDGHVGPNQDLSRFAQLGRFICDRRPDRIVLMGDFITLESLSNWDLSKSGVMEGRRYQEDVEAGRAALKLLLGPLASLRHEYRPQVVYLKGNHENRLDRYLDTKPELKQHLDLVKDMDLYTLGVTEVVEYRDSIEFNGVIFTHAPMNAANQPVAGKYAIHRAAEQTHKSLVFAHTHRKESVNYYRHGADSIIQVATVGAFFEHTESYAYGGLNAYWRGAVLLSHWGDGRFDMEDMSLERLKELY